MKARVLALVLASSAAALAADGPWVSEADVSVHVNGHSFHHARVEGQGCTLSVHLLFDAPENGYSDPKNKVRNYQLFQARVKMAKGQVATSKHFGNAAAGERQYSYDVDTTSDGCWSKAPGKLVKLDVIGCRNRGCDVGAFE
ncbi:MAG TPA: hypothetical protein VH062_33965 [Polyangiaceae bacterium]|jgi:hypothetical protein|nr:hypothetical protein [Polyangiaceae bacterium]